MNNDNKFSQGLYSLIVAWTQLKQVPMHFYK